jgi:hypothetical protein
VAAALHGNSATHSCNSIRITAACVHFCCDNASANRVGAHILGGNLLRQTNRESIERFFDAAYSMYLFGRS